MLLEEIFSGRMVFLYSRRQIEAPELFCFISTLQCVMTHSCVAAVGNVVSRIDA